MFLLVVMRTGDAIHPTNVALFLCQVLATRSDIFTHGQKSLTLMENLSDITLEVRKSKLGRTQTWAGSRHP